MIKGFSRLTRKEKLEYLITNFLNNQKPEVLDDIKSSGKDLVEVIEGLSENVISSYPFPFSIAPNFLIDGTRYVLPMVTEESSVVAAASKSASYWFSRGGFQTEITGLTKKGQVHFKYYGNKEQFIGRFNEWKPELEEAVKQVNTKMVKRGGGIRQIDLLDKTSELEGYYQADVSFDTRDAMGANYMNSCLEGIGEKLKGLVAEDRGLLDKKIQVIMAILSNYSPENAVKVKVECPLNQLNDGKMKVHPSEFAKRFCDAVEIANIDVSRAVTHNKGMYNGIDAVVLATGNDWRAVEANGHAYASRNGRYASLSTAKIQDENFVFEATIPMQIGTVGGVTKLHPMARLSLKILGEPSAERLMGIIASAGLASNFGAVKSLVTTGIQKGHMKMHLSNILAGLSATPEEKKNVEMYFSDKKITYSDVVEFLQGLRE